MANAVDIENMGTGSLLALHLLLPPPPKKSYSPEMTINILMYISSNISESLVIVYIILLFSVILLKLLKVFPYESFFLFGECEVSQFYSCSYIN